MSHSHVPSQHHPQSDQAGGVRRSKEAPSDTRVFTLADLSRYDGSNPTSAILVGAKGKVYDVTDGADFYGVGGSYHAFAGHDASRCLARMKTVYEGADISDLSPEEWNVLNEWVNKFTQKYPIVGIIQDNSQPNSSNVASNL